MIDSSSKGFTLIELLVVIAIIGLLLATGLVSYSRARLLSRDAKRESDVAQIRIALELYFQDIKRYVPADCDANNLPTASGWTALSGSQGLTATINGLGPWATTIPADPINNSTNGYVYSYCSPQADEYKISYKLENGGSLVLIEHP